MTPREAAALATIAVIWGFHFVVIKLAVSELPPMFYAAMRMTLVAAVMFPFLKWRAREMRYILPAGLCLGAFNYAFMFSGLSYATASAAAIAIELHVPFATILSVIFLKDRIGAPRIIGISLAFIGVAVIALGGNHGSSEQSSNIPLGVALIACGALSEAIGAILIKKASGFKPHELLAWFSVIGAVCLWLLTLTVDSGHVEAFAESNKFLIISAVTYSAIGGSIIGHSLYYWLLQRLPVSVVAPSVLLTTVVAVFFGVVLLGDPFGPRMIVGGLLVLSGVGFVLFRNSRKPGSKAPLPEPGGLP